MTYIYGTIMESNQARESASFDDDYHSTRRETIRADLARRLRKVCAHFSDEDFQTLMERMTEQKMRSERRSY